MNDKEFQPMDKTEFLSQLIDALRKEALHAIKASQDAADYATDEEARAESQWDTQGLEASYLAAGQAGQARQWAEAVEELQSERENLLKPRSEVSIGALFTCDLEGSEETFFFAGVAGGHVVSMGGRAVTVITAHSPLAGRLRGLKVGNSFTLPNGKSGTMLTVD
jgi:transcription elongation GreA/GreB family factor